MESQSTFFSTQCVQADTHDNTSTIRWSTIFNCLIANGHSKADLVRYTQRQIELFYKEIQREKNHAKADMIEAVNQGFGGGKELGNYLKKLRQS